MEFEDPRSASRRRWVDVVLNVATVVAAISAGYIGVVFFAERNRSLPTPEEPADVRLHDSLWTALKNGARRLGPANAPVVVVEFTDFECPFCKRFLATIHATRRAFGENVAFVVRHWPLPSHAGAYSAARAAECAGSQGSFFEFHDALLDWPERLSEEVFVSVAKRSGVRDLTAFRACTSKMDRVAAVDADMMLAKAAGGRGTPTIIVNGLRVGKAPDSTRLASIIQAELKRNSRR
jgi:protein-disulfide isomerase